jgi:HEAT repeat protein
MPGDSLWTKLSRSLGLTKPEGAERNEKLEKCLQDLKDAFPDRRRSAAWTLGKIKPPPEVAIAPLEVLAEKDPDLSVRHSAQWALKQIRGA